MLPSRDNKFTYISRFQDSSRGFEADLFTFFAAMLLPLKYNREFFVIIFTLLIAIFTCSLNAQVPISTHRKDVALAFANETEGSAGTIQSLRSHATSDSKIINETHSTIPFGTGSEMLLDMKGYDQEFTRSFTFTNNSSVKFTINNVDFEKKDNKFDFVSIGPDSDLPLDVNPGQTFTIKVTYHSFDRNITCSDKLLVLTEQNKEPFVYPIQALQQPMSDMTWNHKTKK